MIFAEQRGTNSSRDVVLMHGAPSSPVSMWRIGAALLDVARVTNIHMPGYGQSAALRPHDERAALDLVEAALARAGVTRPVLVGYSFGAYRALALALRPSLRARAVVSLSGLHDLSDAHRAGLRASAALGRDHTNDLPALFTSHFLSPEGRRNAVFVDEVSTWLTCIEREDLARELEALSVMPRLELSGLDLPVLARVGELDEATPAALTAALGAALPRARMQRVAGVGHAILLEDEQATADAVRAFVLEHA